MPTESSEHPVRLGVVSFLNSKPLIEGLDRDPHVRLQSAVPSALPDLLRARQVDAALIPVIDLARGEPNWRPISDACIGSDGETLTVRIFSRATPQEMTMLHVDPDSHTSVALASILWSRRYDRRLKLLPFTPGRPLNDYPAVLVIGDKVVTAPAGAYSHQIDLGAAWREWTGLPFVFAVWAAPAGADPRIATILNRARDAGVARAEAIAREAAPAHGWPADLAVEYFTRKLMFTLTPRARQGLARFLELAAEEGLAPQSARVVAADYEKGSGVIVPEAPSGPLRGNDSRPLFDARGNR